MGVVGAELIDFDVRNTELILHHHNHLRIPAHTTAAEHKPHAQHIITTSKTVVKPHTVQPVAVQTDEPLTEGDYEFIPTYTGATAKIPEIVATANFTSFL